MSPMVGGECVVDVNKCCCRFVVVDRVERRLEHSGRIDNNGDGRDVVEIQCCQMTGYRFNKRQVRLSRVDQCIPRGD